LSLPAQVLYDFIPYPLFDGFSLAGPPGHHTLASPHTVSSFSFMCEKTPFSLDYVHLYLAWLLYLFLGYNYSLDGYAAAAFMSEVLLKQFMSDELYFAASLSPSIRVLLFCF
jgi:hypothetical protein